MTNRMQWTYRALTVVYAIVTVALSARLISVKAERDTAVTRAHQFDKLQKERMEACAVAYDDAETTQDSARAEIACGGDEIIPDEKIENDDKPKYMRYCGAGGCAKVPMTRRIDENGVTYYTVP